MRRRGPTPRSPSCTVKCSYIVVPFSLANHVLQETNNGRHEELQRSHRCSPGLALPTPGAHLVAPRVHSAMNAHANRYHFTASCTLMKGSLRNRTPPTEQLPRRITGSHHGPTAEAAGFWCDNNKGQPPIFLACAVKRTEWVIDCESRVGPSSY